MAKKKPKNSSSRKSHPRLKSFLRQAAAIVAAEKGLNADSRLKLQTLATHVKLPQRLFDEALAQLQQGIDSTVSLTRYEKAFVKFLDTEFENVSGDIISPRVENRAIALAKRKYDLDSTRAEQLIAARAETAGMSLISRAEADTFADQAIVDRIGGLIAIDEELDDQIQKIGKKWGLAQVQVERIVAREIARNKADQRRPFKKILATSIVVLLLASALVGSAFTAGWIPEDWLGQTQSTTNILPTANDSSEVTPGSRFPDSTATKLNGIPSSNSQLREPIENISSDDPMQRRLGYQQLVQTACSARDSDQQLLFDLTCELFYADPDEESALNILSAIEDQWKTNPTTIPSVRDLKHAYQVNRLIGQLNFFQSDTNLGSSAIQRIAIRRIAVGRTIRTTLGISLDSVDNFRDYLKISENAIATHQWNRVMQTAWTSPTQAAVLFDPLYELSNSKLDPATLDSYRDDTLVSIIENDASRWRVLQSQIRHSVKRCNDAKLNEWVSIFEDSEDPRLRELLTELILPRIDVIPTSQTPDAISNAIAKFGFQSRNQALLPLINRNERLEQLFSNAIENESGNVGTDILADRIAQLALAVNVEWAFCNAIENATHIDDSSFAEFDRLISIPPQRLRELISLSIDRRGTNTTGATAATASDKRRLDTSLERLRDFDSNSAGSRILAIKQLQQIAHRFEGISYSEAEILAGYLLANLELEELLNVENLVDSFVHWPNLPLAIADQLPDSGAKADQVLTVSRLLLNRNFELGRNVDWKRELRFQILASVNTDLENQVEQDPDNAKSDWNRLRIYLSEVYRERLALAADREFVNNDYPAPDRASARMVEIMANRSNSAKNELDIERAIQLVYKSGANEIEKTAFANQLLVQELSETGVFAESESLLEDLRDKLDQQSLAGDQLHATELALLQVINLKRKSLVQRLLKLDKRP